MSSPSTGRLEAPRTALMSPVTVSIAVVVVLAAVALGFLLIPRGAGFVPTESPTAEPTATATAEPTPTPTPSLAPSATSTPTPEATPTPVAQWTGLTWSDPVTPPFVVHLNDLVPWGDGYVAIGQVAGSDSAFLTSPDGLNWTVAQQVDWDGANALGVRWHLVALRNQLFAFSASTADDAFPHEIINPPLVFQSGDGTSWSLVDSPSWEEAWAEHTLLDVASGPGGIVAVGNAVAGEHGELFTDAMVLHSTDGVGWARAALSGASELSIVWDVIGLGDGFAILGGVQTGPTVGSGPPEAWWSTDGLAWSKSSVEGAVADDNHFEAQTGFASAGGLVARTQMLCAGCPPDLRGWLSNDGQTWLRATDLGVELPSGMMASDGTRLVAFATDEGWTPVGNDPELYPGITRAWISMDAVTWQRIELSHPMTDQLERWWVVPDGVIYAGVQSFWFARAES